MIEFLSVLYRTHDSRAVDESFLTVCLNAYKDRFWKLPDTIILPPDSTLFATGIKPKIEVKYIYDKQVKPHQLRLGHSSDIQQIIMKGDKPPNYKFTLDIVNHL